MNIPLTDVAQSIEVVTGEQVTVPYRKIYGAVVDRIIPGVRLNGRWYVKSEHIPAIATALKLIGRGNKVSA